MKEPLPLVFPWRDNFHLHDFYKEKPRHFWWCVLKDVPCVAIVPEIWYPMLPEYDLKSEMVMWIFCEIHNPFYIHFDSEKWLCYFYFTDEEDAIMFKLIWGNI